jgi:hypothetical protein
MATTRQLYTVKRAFPFEGKIRTPDSPVSMHPRQAVHLLGTHLEEPKPKAAPAKSAAKKSGGNKS